MFLPGTTVHPLDYDYDQFHIGTNLMLNVAVRANKLDDVTSPNRNSGSRDERSLGASGAAAKDVRPCTPGMGGRSLQM